MKGIFKHINKAFQNKVRLGIMSVLMVNDWFDFKGLKELLGVTDGNLASHTTALEKEGYIEEKKEFVNKKPKTSYRATHKGRQAFQDHLDALEQIIRQQN